MVHTANHMNTLVILVTLAHLLAERQKGLANYNIILHYSSILFVHKNITETSKDTLTTTKVDVGIVMNYFTLPINVAYHLSTLCNILYILRAVCTRSILDEIQFRRLCFTYGLKYSLEGIWPVEENHCYGNICLKWLHIVTFYLNRAFAKKGILNNIFNLNIEALL